MRRDLLRRKTRDTRSCALDDFVLRHHMQRCNALAYRENIVPLTLYMHPLSSYCHKALIAFHENATPFTAVSSISAIRTSARCC